MSDSNINDNCADEQAWQPEHDHPRWPRWKAGFETPPFEASNLELVELLGEIAAGTVTTVEPRFERKILHCKFYVNFT